MSRAGDQYNRLRDDDNDDGDDNDDDNHNDRLVGGDDDDDDDDDDDQQSEHGRLNNDGAARHDANASDDDDDDDDDGSNSNAPIHQQHQHQQQHRDGWDRLATADDDDDDDDIGHNDDTRTTASASNAMLLDPTGEVVVDVSQPTATAHQAPAPAPAVEVVVGQHDSAHSHSHSYHSDSANPLRPLHAGTEHRPVDAGRQLQSGLPASSSSSPSSSSSSRGGTGVTSTAVQPPLPSSVSLLHGGEPAQQASDATAANAAAGLTANGCQPSLIDRVGILSRITFWWANPLLRKGYKGALQMSDLWDLADRDGAVVVCQRFEVEWEAELARGRAEVERARRLIASNSANGDKASLAGETTSTTTAAAPGLAAHLVLDPIPAPRSPRNLFGLLSRRVVRSSRLADNVSVARTFVRTFKRELMRTHMLLTLQLFFVFFAPTFLLRELVAYAQDRGAQPVWHGILLALGILLNETGRSLVVSQSFTESIRVAGRARSVMFGIVYKKAMRLRTLGNKSIGEVINMASNDGQRVYDAFVFGSFTYSSTLSTVVGLAASFAIIGPFSLVGCGVFIMFYPIQAMIARAVARQRRETIAFTDTRVRLMNELLTCMRLVKCYAWEDSFASKVGDIRSSERRVLSRASYLQSMNFSLTPLVPTLASVLLFTFHSLAGQTLSASTAFSITSMFNAMRNAMNQLPQAVKNVGEALISLARIKSFLLMDEFSSVLSSPSNSLDAIKFRDASFSWARPEDDIRTTGVESAVVPARRPGTKVARLLKRIGLRKGKNTTEPIALEASAPSSSSSSGAGVGGGRGAGGKRGGAKSGPPKPIGRIKDVSLTVEKGHLIGVCGAVGSGKSSLLSAVLGQMLLDNGDVSVSGSIAYASQQAWIFNSSLRANILFGQPFNQEAYDHAIDVCCLRADIAMLPDGDMTEIGERGINLSGGQKQRVSLARAVYSNKDIYLLDDPLSAVDAHVGKHIFNECIVRSLHQKTVVLVTHQLQYLPNCDLVVVMDDGRIGEQGTFEQLMSIETSALRSLIRTFHSSTADEPSGIASISPIAPVAVPAATSGVADAPPLLRRESRRGTLLALLDAHNAQTKPETSAPVKNAPEKSEKSAALMSKEEKMEGAISKATYLEYMRAGGGVRIFLALALVFVFSMSIKAFSDWWLSYWLRQPPSTIMVNTTIIDSNGTVSWGWVEEPVTSFNLKDYPDFGMYVGVYCASAVLLMLVQMVRALFFLRTTLTASQTMHRAVFDKVMHAPMSFFDTTPTGRLLSRFSKDMDEVDVKLPFYAEQLLQNGSLILLTFGILAVIFPYFLLVFIPLGGLFAVFNTFFNRSARELKRLDNISRSPIFSHLTASVQGTATIRAYGMMDLFINEYMKQVDANSRAFFAFYIANRWLSIRLDALTTLVSTATAFFIVLTTGSLSPALAGLALSYSLQTSGMFQFTVRLIAETQSRFVSVERIQYYTRTTPQEGIPPPLEDDADASGNSSGRLSGIEEDGDDDDAVKEKQTTDDDHIALVLSGAAGLPTGRAHVPSSRLQRLLARVHKPSGHGHAVREPLPLVNVHYAPVNVPEDWPAAGVVEFRNLKMRYRDGLPLVLKGLSFKTRPQEKIGVVGPYWCWQVLDRRGSLPTGRGERRLGGD
ncbi:multidrug resistance-associated protein 9 [Capsaspora owczarzaki ATCC 30864]|uniref:Multidrug resistance-associated protein 9 n=1 Tax=Capsaspora owczarzaki (strain ATCC 30864) TaxID=595528 RepID=A0A0D2VF92_CAPO3|nr:multidrug resistance-associated protein 9 [Capsaspora owczarzaki ATCC 30864]KJE88387.1 multidrug resistance-associated protein 9 [Capsaspora owczarzaki ATCC 30864]|eukprot:XP_004364920.2 multidrug resistance-associated protein 9 [Capsaspora owczarzaki ATCC 30864]